MKPFLFSQTYFETPTYYVLYLLGFLGAILLLSKRAPKYGFDSVRAIDLGIITFAFGVLGARLFHIFFESFDYYLAHPIRVFYFWQGGFVLFGGLILGTLSGIFYLRAKKEPVLKWGDLAAPSMMLGIGIGRFGCLAAGCCYGKYTPWWWGIIFSDERSGAPLHIPLHPTQLLEALFCSLMAYVLCVLAKRVQWKTGSLFFLMGISYSVFRFFIEFLRGDRERGLYFEGGISTSQVVSILVVATCILAMNLTKKS